MYLGRCTLAFLSLLLSSHLAIAREKTLELRDSSEVFAQSGEVLVTYSDILSFVAERVPKDQRTGFINSPERIGRVLDAIYQPEFFLQRMWSEGLFKSTDLALLRREVAEQAAVIYIERKVDERRLLDYGSLAREIFLSEPELFKSPLRFTFDHLFFAVEDPGAEVEVLKVVTELFDLLSQSNAVAATVSDLTQRFPNLNHGHFEEIASVELAEEVYHQLQDIEPNTWSRPVRSGRGWHFVRLLERFEPTALNWNEAEPLARELARNRHEEQIRETVLRAAVAQGWVFPEGAVRELLGRYGLSGFNEVEQALEEQNSEER